MINVNVVLLLTDGAISSSGLKNDKLSNMIKDNKEQELSDSTKPLLLIARVMCRTFSNMFFWFGIQLFDSRLKEYGGFNHFIAGKIFRWKYSYLSIALRKQWRFEWIHESDDYYYDGYHNSITIGCLQISYGT